MSEELLITLGVKDKNATAQIRALERQIKALDTQLKASSISGKAMDTSFTGLANKFSLLANKMKAMQTSLGAWKTKLNQANENIARQKALMSELSAAGQTNSTAYAKAASELDRYRAEANKAQNGIKLLETQISNLNGELKTTSAQLNNFGLLKFGEHAITFGNHMLTAGNAIKDVGRGITSVGQTISTLSVPFALATVGAAKAVIAYEDAFAGVRKTVDATETQFQQLSDAIRDMSKEMPTSANEIASVAEAAGQLGVAYESIEGFTKTMVMLGDTTNLSANEAATAMAKFMNVTGHTDSTSKDYVETVKKLGSVLVHLGNNTATTELDIMNMASRLAAAGHQVGMSEQQIFALSASLSSVGLASEMGGSAFSKLMVKMQVACEEGGDALKDFEKIAGADFKQTFEQDAYGAMMKFVQGLAAGGEQGESAIKMLSDMGIEEVRLRDSILRATNANELFTKTQDLANEAFSENNALTEEAKKRYETTASKLEMLKNKVYDLGISLGEKLLPHIENFVSGAEDLVKWFGNLDEGTQGWILKLGVLLPIVGLGVTALGKLTTGIGNVVVGGSHLVTMLGKWAVNHASVASSASMVSSAMATTTATAASASSAIGGIGAAGAAAAPLISGTAIALGGAAAAIGLAGTAWYLNEKKIAKGTEAFQKTIGEVEDFTGKLRTNESIWTEMFGKTYTIKFSDEYKQSLKQVETDVQAWVDRVREMDKNIEAILNDTSIDENTKKEQISKYLNPMIEEIQNKTKEVNEGLSQNQKNLQEYLMDTLSMTYTDAQEYARLYKESHEAELMEFQNLQTEKTNILQNALNENRDLTDIELTELAHIEERSGELQKNLAIANGEDLYNILKQNKLAEMSLLKASTGIKLDELNRALTNELSTINEHYEKKRQAIQDDITMSDEQRQRALANLDLQVQAERDYTRQYADLCLQKMSADEEWLKANDARVSSWLVKNGEVTQVIDDNTGKILSCMISTEDALKDYADVNGLTVDHITDKWGEKVSVARNSEGIIVASVYSEQEAYQKYAKYVAEAMQDYCTQIKNGKKTTDQAMSEIQRDLESGVISCEEFGFKSNEEFLRCARSALDAEGDVSKMQITIDNLHGKEVTVRANTVGLNTLEYAKSVLDSLRSKNVNVHYTTSGNLVTQPTKGGQWTITEQGTSGTLGEDRLTYINESVRKSRGWELVDGPHEYLGRDNIGDIVNLKAGASVKSNTTSTAMMKQAVKEEVARAMSLVQGTYLDYTLPTSALSRLALGGTSNNTTVNNNFDDSNLSSLLNLLIQAVQNQNMSPNVNVNLNAKSLAKATAPYMDKELDIRRRRK